MQKPRLDKLLFEKRLVESREKARALILEGKVFVNGVKVDKAGTPVRVNASLEILQRMPYVSRGGLKLESAIRGFNIDVKGKAVMDVGASTGGFTDCFLQHGVKKVYAIDVGYGQLDSKLRNDPRVVLLEKTNIRYLKKTVDSLQLTVHSQRLEDLINNNIDIATIDVSFISLLKVIPEVLKFLKKNGEILALIKPQFEADRKDIKKGVVKDEAQRLQIVEKIKTEAEKMGLGVEGIIQSPIKGPKGNIEYFIYLKK